MHLKKAIGIKRRSDIKQIGNSSFETQESEILLKAEKEGYHIIEIIEDEANSAYHKTVTKRDAMNELLQKVLDEELNIEAVFFYDESRLTRQFHDFTLDIYRKIKESKPYVKFFSTAQHKEWSPYEITSVINFANAAKFSIQNSRRAKDAQSTMLYPGNGSNPKRPGSKVPYGYSKDDDGILIPNEFASVVILIFHLTSWGHSQDKIANFLNELNISSPSNKQWVSNTIDYILNNQHYLGHLPWNIGSSHSSVKKKHGNYDLFLNQHEAIVPVSLWHLAHHTIQLHKIFGKNNSSQFVLRDLIYCKKCSRKLIARDNTPAQSTKKYLVYRCPNCKNKVSIEKLHKTVFEELFSKFSMKLTSLTSEIKAIITKRRKKIMDYLKELKVQREQIIFNERQVLNSDSTITEDMDFVFSVAKNTVQNKIDESSQFIEMLDSLLEDDSLQKIIKNISTADLKKFQNVELRTLLLSMLKDIQINLEDNTLEIKYRLSPFTPLENFIQNIS